MHAVRRGGLYSGSGRRDFAARLIAPLPVKSQKSHNTLELGLNTAPPYERAQFVVLSVVGHHAAGSDACASTDARSAEQ